MTATRGFTLLEILLVLVLVSASAVAVIATFRFPSKMKPKSVRRVFISVCCCSMRKRFSAGKILACGSMSIRAVSLLQLTADKGWQKWQNDKMTNQTTLKEGLQLDFELGGGAWQKDDRLFNPGSLFDEEMFADEKKSKTGTGFRNCLCYRVAK